MNKCAKFLGGALVGALAVAFLIGIFVEIRLVGDALFFHFFPELYNVPASDRLGPTILVYVGWLCIHIGAVFGALTALEVK